MSPENHSSNPTQCFKPIFKRILFDLATDSDGVAADAQAAVARALRHPAPDRPAGVQRQQIPAVRGSHPGRRARFCFAADQSHPSQITRR